MKNNVICLATACRARANEKFNAARTLMQRVNAFDEEGKEEFADVLLDRVEQLSLASERYDALAEVYGRESIAA